MDIALAFVPVPILLLVIAFLMPVLARLFESPAVVELTTEWLENFHVSSYRPMQGLLAPEDFEFLSKQPGFDPCLFRKLRRDRLRIFREYLNRLIADYNRLYTLANLVISQSPDDQSKLFARLLSLRFVFGISILRVECSYLLCCLGTRSIFLGGILDQMEAISKIALPPSDNLSLAS